MAFLGSFEEDSKMSLKWFIGTTKQIVMEMVFQMRTMHFQKILMNGTTADGDGVGDNKCISDEDK